MVDYEMNVRLSEISKKLNEVNENVNIVIKVMKPEEDLWDGSDIVRNWKVSERTLATWRKAGLISYIKVNDKIWYPRKSREEFIMRNLIHNKYE